MTTIPAPVHPNLTSSGPNLTSPHLTSPYHCYQAVWRRGLQLAVDHKAQNHHRSQVERTCKVPGGQQAHRAVFSPNVEALRKGG